MSTVVLFRLLPAAVCLHVFEEFVFPGGFGGWYRDYKPELAGGMTAKFFFRINAALIAGTLWTGLAGPSHAGFIWWLIFAGIIGTNAGFHLKGMLAMKRYSPGVISSVLLYLPLAVTGLVVFLRDGDVSPVNAFLALLAGPAYHIFSAWDHARKTLRPGNSRGNR